MCPALAERGPGYSSRPQLAARVPYSPARHSVDLSLDVACVVYSTHASRPQRARAAKKLLSCPQSRLPGLPRTWVFGADHLDCHVFCDSGVQPKHIGLG